MGVSVGVWAITRLGRENCVFPLHLTPQKNGAQSKCISPLSLSLIPMTPLQVCGSRMGETQRPGVEGIGYGNGNGLTGMAWHGILSFFVPRSPGCAISLHHDGWMVPPYCIHLLVVFPISLLSMRNVVPCIVVGEMGLQQAWFFLRLA